MMANRVLRFQNLHEDEEEEEDDGGDEEEEEDHDRLMRLSCVSVCMNAFKCLCVQCKCACVRVCVRCVCIQFRLGICSRKE